MAITDKKKGVWGLDQTYNKINQGSIWTYNLFDTPIFLSWGSNIYGQLGQNDVVYRSSPTQLSGSDYDLTQVGNCGVFGETNPLRKTDGTLWVVGRNNYGQAGQSTTIEYSSPVQVGSGTDWAYCVAVPGYSIKSTKTDGTLWAWGASYYGEAANNIANPSDWSISSPIQIPGTNWDSGIRKLGLGDSIRFIINKTRVLSGLILLESLEHYGHGDIMIKVN